MGRGNVNNLVLNSRRTGEELREIARKGGIKSGIARRKQKEAREFAKKVGIPMLEVMLNSEIKPQNIKNFVKAFGGGTYSDKDITFELGIKAGQIKEAIKGNTRAYETIMEEKQKIARNKVEATKLNTEESIMVAYKRGEITFMQANELINQSKAIELKERELAIKERDISNVDTGMLESLTNVLRGEV